MLNTQAFVVLAGNPEPWDEEIRRRCAGSGKRAGCYDSDDLCRVQCDQHARGRRSALLTRTIYGWCVRLNSGLDNRQILYGRRDEREICKAKAIEWGKRWANLDPERREFIAHKSDLVEANATAELA